MSKDVKVITEQDKEILYKPKLITRIRARISGIDVKNLQQRRTPSEVKAFDDFLSLSVKTYQKESMKDMVEDLPDVRGAITTIINATIGDYKFITANKDDHDKEDEKVKEVSTWYGNPKYNFRKVQEQIMWSRLMRANVFIELQGKGNSGWMYVLSGAFCEPAYNEKKTKIVGIDYKAPGAKNADGSQKVFKIRDTKKGEGFIFAATDLIDGAEEGFPPLMSLIEDANLYVSARAFVKSLYKSGGLGRLAFIGEELSEDEYEAMKEDLKQRKGTSIALRGKIKIQNLSSTPKDMMFKELDDKWSEKVMTTFSVPPVMLCKPGATGLKDDKSSLSAFSSRVRAEKRFLENTTDRCVIKIFGDDYSHVRKKLAEWIDPVTKAEIFLKLSEAGAVTPNIIRNEYDLPKIEQEWGNFPFNFNLWPQIAAFFMDDVDLPAETQPQSAEMEKFIKLIDEVLNDYIKRKEFTKKLAKDDFYATDREKV